MQALITQMYDMNNGRSTRMDFEPRTAGICVSLLWLKVWWKRTTAFDIFGLQFVGVD